LLKHEAVLGKLAGRIGTLRGPDLARGPGFEDRCTTRRNWNEKSESSSNVTTVHKGVGTRSHPTTPLGRSGFLKSLSRHQLMRGSVMSQLSFMYMAQ